ncbi:MAG: SH3 domain-containing protein [Acidobacteriota bacterium]
MFFNKNSVIFLVIAAFLTFSFSPIVESAQTKNGTKPTPTPTKKKTTPTPTPKKSVKTTPTPKPKVVPTPKVSSTPKTSPSPVATPVKELPQLIATAAGARVRKQASTSSAELSRVKLGSIIKVLEKTKADWYRIEIPAKPKNVIGWMSGQVADDWDANKREEIYRRIAEKNYKSDKMSFLDASELAEFLDKAQNELKNSKYSPDFAYKQLMALRQSLRAIPNGKDNANPYKSFLKTNEKYVVYSEPSAEWYIRSEVIWDLQKKYVNAPIAEEIAWIGAENPLPGECEGYVNCYLFQLRESDARYLELYPNGKRSAESLKNIQNQLDPIIADLTEKQIYNGPTDVTDRAEFNRLIAEIRTIVSKLFLAEFEKQKTIQQLNQIAEGFR